IASGILALPQPISTIHPPGLASSAARWANASSVALKSIRSYSAASSAPAISSGSRTRESGMVVVKNFVVEKTNSNVTLVVSTEKQAHAIDFRAGGARPSADPCGGHTGRAGSGAHTVPRPVRRIDRAIEDARELAAGGAQGVRANGQLG